MRHLCIMLLVLTGCSAQPDLNGPFNGPFRVGRYSGQPNGLSTLTKGDVLREANTHFTYRGRHIPPLLFKYFKCALSDLNPIVYSVDVSATHDSNEYSEEILSKGGWVVQSRDLGNDLFEQMAYEWGGPDSQGNHVVKAKYFSGDGRLTENSTYVVRFEIGTSEYPEGGKFDQLIMKLVRVAQ